MDTISHQIEDDVRAEIACDPRRSQTMSHQFSFPKVTEIGRVSLEIAGLPIPRARPGRGPSPPRAPAVERP